MKTADARTKLLSAFSQEIQQTLIPIIDTLIDAAKREGITTGRMQAATMIEQIVLGADEYSDDDLRGIMSTLRNVK